MSRRFAGDESSRRNVSIASTRYDNSRHWFASFTGTVSTTGISLSVNGGTRNISWTYVIDPPPGTSFHVGYYPRVMRAEFATPGYAGLDISGEHFRPENHLGKPGDEHLPLCGDQDRVIGEPGRGRPLRWGPRLCGRRYQRSGVWPSKRPHVQGGGLHRR